MAIHNASYGSGAKNNGGVALKAGVPLESNQTALKTFTNKRRAENYPFGSTLVNGVNIKGINQDLSIPVPWSSARPLVKRTTRVLAGRPNNNVLTSGTYASELRNTIHAVDSYRTRLQNTAYRNHQFNLLTGKFSVGYPDNQVDDFGLDTAAILTRADQGNLTFKNYRNISIVPYQSKTG